MLRSLGHQAINDRISASKVFYNLFLKFIEVLLIYSVV